MDSLTLCEEISIPQLGGKKMMLGLWKLSLDLYLENNNNKKKRNRREKNIFLLYINFENTHSL